MREQAIYQVPDQKSAIKQGEILTGVVQYKPVLGEGLSSEEEVNFSTLEHPYAIVVTQDCDLDWDYKERLEEKAKSSKYLNSVLLCEIGTAREIRDADHMNRKAWELVASHRHERFYFFEKIPPECELEQEGLVELTADFKKVFGIDAETLYKQIEIGIAKRRTVLVSPYIEHFSSRYHNFHSRVALPSQYESERE